MAEGTTIKRYICRVHHMDMDRENRDVPITVCVNDAMNRKVFAPGQEVELTESEVAALKDSYIDSQIPIPWNSGIYQARNPMTEAKKQYPDMIIEKDARSGLLTAIKRQPRFLVEIIREVK